MSADVSYLKAESYKLIGAAFEVYNTVGYGLAEEFYQECLEIEMETQQIAFKPKEEIGCYYKGRKLRKRYIPDLILFGSIIVELKAVSAMNEEHESQLLNYMRLTKQPLGYLINFGRKGGLDFKRFVLSEFLPK